MEVNIANNKLIITDDKKEGKAENAYTFENIEFWRVCFFWSANHSFEVEILEF